jgi:Pyridoxamine 5'-phosphate oxidase like
VPTRNEIHAGHHIGLRNGQQFAVKLANTVRCGFEALLGPSGRLFGCGGFFFHRFARCCSAGIERGIPAKAWWNSPDDPNIRVLKVTPIDAQYWDAPGSTVAYVKMAAAALTGSRPSMGENRKVTM